MLGDGAMIKMAQSKVFLSGLGGLGVEIGKILQQTLQPKLFVIYTCLYNINMYL